MSNIPDKEHVMKPAGPADIAKMVGSKRTRDDVEKLNGAAGVGGGGGVGGVGAPAVGMGAVGVRADAGGLMDEPSKRRRRGHGNTPIQKLKTKMSYILRYPQYKVPPGKSLENATHLMCTMCDSVIQIKSHNLRAHMTSTKCRQMQSWKREEQHMPAGVESKDQRLGAQPSQPQPQQPQQALGNSGTPTVQRMAAEQAMALNTGNMISWCAQKVSTKRHHLEMFPQYMVPPWQTLPNCTHFQCKYCMHLIAVKRHNLQQHLKSRKCQVKRAAIKGDGAGTLPADLSKDKGNRMPAEYAIKLSTKRDYLRRFPQFQLPAGMSIGQAVRLQCKRCHSLITMTSSGLRQHMASAKCQDRLEAGSTVSLQDPTGMPPNEQMDPLAEGDDLSYGVAKNDTKRRYLADFPQFQVPYGVSLEEARRFQCRVCGRLIQAKLYSLSQHTKIAKCKELWAARMATATAEKDQGGVAPENKQPQQLADSSSSGEVEARQRHLVSLLKDAGLTVTQIAAVVERSTQLWHAMSGLTPFREDLVKKYYMQQ